MSQSMRAKVLAARSQALAAGDYALAARLYRFVLRGHVVCGLSDDDWRLDAMLDGLGFMPRTSSCGRWANYRITRTWELAS